AALGGIRPGDVIMQVAGKPINSVPGLLSAVAALRPGEKTVFQVQRGDRMLELGLTPGVRPQPQRMRQR
ncbi:MAG: PDZ domain-containing protein, partial [Burkholderiaceae bacterium]|nr:PDZ domain-containing protein [Burkholderiaceae bacterium]